VIFGLAMVIQQPLLNNPFVAMLQGTSITMATLDFGSNVYKNITLFSPIRTALEEP